LQKNANQSGNDIIVTATPPCVALHTRGELSLYLHATWISPGVELARSGAYHLKGQCNSNKPDEMKQLPLLG